VRGEGREQMREGRGEKGEEWREERTEEERRGIEQSSTQ